MPALWDSRHYTFYQRNEIIFFNVPRSGIRTIVMEPNRHIKIVPVSNPPLAVRDGPGGSRVAGRSAVGY